MYQLVRMVIISVMMTMIKTPLGASLLLLCLAGKKFAFSELATNEPDCTILGQDITKTRTATNDDR